MTDLYDRINVAAAAVRQHTDLKPDVALILGSGLGALADDIAAAATVAYADIPHFPRSTVEGHRGELVIGNLSGCNVAVMRGRFHYYEGYELDQTTFPVRVLRELGAHTLIVTNAAGGLRADWQVGDLMRIADHINFPGMTGQHPLRGPNDPRLGLRFPALTDAYDAGLGRLLHSLATAEGITLHDGVYAMLTGPSFETPAELRMLQLLGIDAVGMSTVPEVIVARHGGMRVLGISMISNIATPDAPPANHEEVLAAGEAVKPKFTALLKRLLAELC
ncbi:MAG: purine-nucleoside phosphorylase [Chloroflexota bacterium]|nr:purine-nucleoside phosphorylase [Chloroflexota bacterium]